MIIKPTSVRHFKGNILITIITSRPKIAVVNKNTLFINGNSGPKGQNAQLSKVK